MKSTRKPHNVNNVRQDGHTTFTLAYPSCIFLYCSPPLGCFLSQRQGSRLLRLPRHCSARCRSSSVQAGCRAIVTDRRNTRDTAASRDKFPWFCITVVTDDLMRNDATRRLATVSFKYSVLLAGHRTSSGHEKNAAATTSCLDLLNLVINNYRRKLTCRFPRHSGMADSLTATSHCSMGQ